MRVCSETLENDRFAVELPGKADRIFHELAIFVNRDGPKREDFLVYPKIISAVRRHGSTVEAPGRASREVLAHGLDRLDRPGSGRPWPTLSRGRHAPRVLRVFEPRLGSAKAQPARFPGRMQPFLRPVTEGQEREALFLELPAFPETVRHYRPPSPPCRFAPLFGGLYGYSARPRTSEWGARVRATG